MIITTVDTAFEAGILSLKRGFGYVDNQFIGKAPYTYPDNPYTNEIENSGGDSFDISWAIDSTGSYVDLDEIDFIRVHTAVMDGAGWLGQISTEIRGAVDVLPRESSKGNNKLLVIREIPLMLDTSNFQLEVFAFVNGRIKHDEKILWTSNMNSASIDGNNILHVSQSGNLTLTAQLASDHEITSSVSTTVDLGTSILLPANSSKRILNIYPNPAQKSIRIQGGEWFSVTIWDVSGKKVIQRSIIPESETVQVSHLSKGIYFIRASQNKAIYSGKFIKN